MCICDEEQNYDYQKFHQSDFVSDGIWRFYLLLPEFNLFAINMRVKFHISHRNFVNNKLSN